ncbi:MAG: hypothetical protein ACLR2K_00240 [Paraclostridium sordellii]
MINGIIKLFYSEIVKTKMKSMPNKQYSIRDEYKEMSNIAMKVDSTFMISIKAILTLFLIVMSLRINLIFGIGTILILGTYILYKIYIENQFKNHVKNSVGNLKNNIEQGTQYIVTDKIKQKINALISLLLIGIFSNFNYIIIGCFILVFMFTIKDIYSNINK